MREILSKLVVFSFSTFHSVPLISEKACDRPGFEVMFSILKFKKIVKMGPEWNYLNKLHKYHVIKIKTRKNLQWICGDSDVSDLKLATFFEFWWQNFDLGDIFLMLVSDTSIKR